ncbi:MULTISPECIES: diguanylate cyclase [Gammaproteobacteria]|uniref:sensor domain-containing diguanylate cyclase n=1 Tax=Gammaproteobacteria TaxID=1236 RepID=UPI000DD0B8CF|nr:MULTISPECIES: diguanylate cyclase [Gammaproteobacteria]RTE86886.1 diguanylate cyclase [Aliidiomarina sp. B3213]TCZ93324.1 diguanylate cyclase [Lysobacter sp. N42]
MSDKGSSQPLLPTEVLEGYCTALLEQFPVAIISSFEPITGNASSLYANEAACKLLQLNSQNPDFDEIESLPFSLDADLTGFSEMRRPKDPPITQALQGFPVERRDLLIHERAINIRSHAIEFKGKVIHSALIMERDHRLFVVQRDAADLLSSEFSLRDMIAFDKLMSQLSSQLINAQGEEIFSHIENALEAVGEFCQSDRAYIFEFSNEGESFSNTFEWVREGITSHIDELKDIPREALPWFFQCMEQEGLFLVHDTSLIPEQGQAEREEFENEDIRSVICVGMYAHNKLIGVVGCDMVARHRHWTEADTRRLKLVGEIIANSLQSEQYMRSLKATQQELIEANESLKELAHKDGLTGIANRRHFDSRLQEEVARAIRHSHSVTLLLLDIDFFKAFNDHYGHIAGDHALRSVAKLLTEYFRRSGEVVARFGGEEFAVLLPEGTLEQALELAQSFQVALKELAIPHDTSEVSNHLSVSIGIAHKTPSDMSDAEHAILEADEALYQAKKVGRNRGCYRIGDDFKELV